MMTDTGDWAGQSLCEGRYQVRSRLGEGGMAFVYRAHDEAFDCDVVIKVPRQTMMQDAEFAARFLREIRSLKRLAHPHVVAVVEAGSHGTTPFVVLEYLPGGSLRDRQRSGPQEPAALSGWLEGVAGALDYLHGQGLVHRDVKPDNILFDAQGRVKLGDFGVVKVLTQDGTQRAQTVMTAAGMVLGTPQYMAPELILARPYDGRLDQYALAVTAYEFVTGRPPFDGKSATAVFLKHVSDAPPSAASVRPGVPAALAKVLQRAMAKNPADRYGSCAEFARAALRAAGAPAGARAVLLICPHCQKAVAPTADGRGGRKCPSCERPMPPAEEPLFLLPLPGAETVSSDPDGKEPTDSRPRPRPRDEVDAEDEEEGGSGGRTAMLLVVVFGALALVGLLALVAAVVLVILFG
jgi:serine/threonine-protein kinase